MFTNLNQKKENKKKVLLISQWYKPINAAAANRTSRIAEVLLKIGYDVTVVTGMPSYPTGILPRKYYWKLWYKEKIDDINVLRTYEYPTANKGVLKRLLNNISFMISASIAVMILPAHEKVIISSPSFLSGIPGLLAKRLWRAEFYFDVRDLWPDSAISLGFLRNNLFCKVALKLEKIYYQNSFKITVATPSIKEHLITENIPEEKIAIILNSVDTKVFKPINIDKTKYGFLRNDFIVAYIGNLGAAQNLETTIKSAKMLATYPRIKFLFVGEGEEKDKLIQLAKKLTLTNIIFWNEKNHSEIPNIINFSDVALVSLAKENIFQKAVPSKALEYFACGKPILACVKGSLRDYIQKYNAGLVFKAGVSTDQTKAILKLYNEPKLRVKMGQNGRQVAVNYFSNQVFYKNLSSLF